jgi:hypothetical protein
VWKVGGGGKKELYLLVAKENLIKIALRAFERVRENLSTCDKKM